MNFDSKTDTPENALVTLQTKATTAYPDPDPPAVAPIDPHAADAALAETGFDQDTARRANNMFCSRHVQFKLGVILSKVCLYGYVRSCSSNPKILQ